MVGIWTLHIGLDMDTTHWLGYGHYTLVGIWTLHIGLDMDTTHWLGYGHYTLVVLKNYVPFI
jgi:hypothetical protein